MGGQAKARRKAAPRLSHSQASKRNKAARPNQKILRNLAMNVPEYIGNLATKSFKIGSEIRKSPENPDFSH
jgi:hypothetical protein